jgi:hypothetical protein
MLEFFKIRLVIIFIYIFYIGIGLKLLHLVKRRNYELARWVHAAPSTMLYFIVLSLWPIVILAYYLLPEGRKK